MTAFPSFLMLNDIPLYVNTVFYLSMYLSTGIWVASIPWLFGKMMLPVV